MLFGKNFRKLCRRIHEKIAFRSVIVIGDSHARIFFHDLFRMYFPFTRFDVCWVGGATVSGLDNPNSKTQASTIFREKIQSIQKRKKVILMLGEVDTGFVIWYRYQKDGGDLDAMLDKALLNYYDLISWVNERNDAMVISTPLPTISDDNEWGEVADQRKAIKVSQLERTKLTLRFNQSVDQYCQQRGIPFLNLDSESMGADGLVSRNLLNDDKSDHHYKAKEYAQLILRRLRLEI